MRRQAPYKHALKVRWKEVVQSLPKPPKTMASTNLGVSCVCCVEQFLQTVETAADMITPRAATLQKNSLQAPLNWSATQWAIVTGSSANRPREIITLRFCDEEGGPMCFKDVVKGKLQLALPNPSCHLSL